MLQFCVTNRKYSAGKNRITKVIEEESFHGADNSSVTNRPRLDSPSGRNHLPSLPGCDVRTQVRHK